MHTFHKSESKYPQKQQNIYNAESKCEKKSQQGKESSSNLTKKSWMGSMQLSFTQLDHWSIFAMEPVKTIHQGIISLWGHSRPKWSTTNMAWSLGIDHQMQSFIVQKQDVASRARHITNNPSLCSRRIEQTRIAFRICNASDIWN